MSVRKSRGDIVSNLRGAGLSLRATATDKDILESIRDACYSQEQQLGPRRRMRGKGHPQSSVVVERVARSLGHLEAARDCQKLIRAAQEALNEAVDEFHPSAAQLAELMPYSRQRIVGALSIGDAIPLRAWASPGATTTPVKAVQEVAATKSDSEILRSVERWCQRSRDRTVKPNVRIVGKHKTPATLLRHEKSKVRFAKHVVGVTNLLFGYDEHTTLPLGGASYDGSCERLLLLLAEALKKAPLAARVSGDEVVRAPVGSPERAALSLVATGIAQELPATREAAQEAVRRWEAKPPSAEREAASEAAAILMSPGGTATGGMSPPEDLRRAMEAPLSGGVAVSAEEARKITWLAQFPKVLKAMAVGIAARYLAPATSAAMASTFSFFGGALAVAGVAAAARVLESQGWELHITDQEKQALGRALDIVRRASKHNPEIAEEFAACLILRRGNELCCPPGPFHAECVDALKVVTKFYDKGEIAAILVWALGAGLLLSSSVATGVLLGTALTTHFQKAMLFDSRLLVGSKRLKRTLAEWQGRRATAVSDASPPQEEGGIKRKAQDNESEQPKSRRRVGEHTMMQHPQMDQRRSSASHRASHHPAPPTPSGGRLRKRDEDDSVEPPATRRRVEEHLPLALHREDELSPASPPLRPLSIYGPAPPLSGVSGFLMRVPGLRTVMQRWNKKQQNG